MAIDRNLNLIYTIDRGEDPAPRVFAIPVGQAIFDIYYRATVSRSRAPRSR